MNFPRRKCSLQRQDCLVGDEFAARMNMANAAWSPPPATHDHEPASPSGPAADVEPAAAMHEQAGDALLPASNSNNKTQAPSRFETILVSHPPVFETLLLHLPTQSILDLLHTSSRLRSFLRLYPLAWNNLSFRQYPGDPPFTPLSSGAESPESSTRAYSIAFLLRTVVSFGTRLTRLDLDGSSVSGSELYAQILTPRRGTLQHLSVRNCKYVSLKYHVVNFLYLEYRHPRGVFGDESFALKSLYTYKCRHHRRRPYLRGTLSRRDSDAFPTHQLVHICHLLGIWTDTGWCTTPGSRCLRRKEYAFGRVSPESTTEIWIPFDRLWRSQNYIGPPPSAKDCVAAASTTKTAAQSCRKDICVWETEPGHAGEPLGSGDMTRHPSKETPAHMRRSYSLFVDGIICSDCEEKIYERCESCSIQMHCVCCRQTLCASCAFDRPLPRKKNRRNDAASQDEALPSQSADSQLSTPSGPDNLRFWWPPGTDRSPNAINQNLSDDEDSSEEGGDENPQQNIVNRRSTNAKITLKPCCRRIEYFDTYRSDARAAPLPKDQGFEDIWALENDEDPEALPAASAFVNASDQSVEDDAYPLYSTVQYPPRLPWGPHTMTHDGTFSPLRGKTAKRTRKVAPFDANVLDCFAAGRRTPRQSARNVCMPCYKEFAWNTRCAFKDCQNILCLEHDMQLPMGVRQCGSRWISHHSQSTLLGNRTLGATEDAPGTQQAFRQTWRPVAQRMQKQLDQLENTPQAARRPASPLSTATNRAFNSSGSSPLGPSQAPPRSSSTTRLRSSSDPLAPVQQEPSAYSDDSSILAADPRSSSRKERSTQIESSTFTGCQRIFCPSPQERFQTDTRPPCSAWEYLVPCSSCGVLACFDCSGMEMGCPCTVCSAPIKAPDRFLCPGCLGDSHISRAVRERTVEFVASGQRWPSVERDQRFWRCNFEQEARTYEELKLEKARREEERKQKEREEEAARGWYNQMEG